MWNCRKCNQRVSADRWKSFAKGLCPKCYTDNFFRKSPRVKGEKYLETLNNKLENTDMQPIVKRLRKKCESG